MDLRIVNTCNNNCLYCLEQELRTQDKYITTEVIETSLINNSESNLTFYGGNPLLHPDLKNIIIIAKENEFHNV
jgi:sulfatase maturation enzyme AslB (radical SAM superfamily)